MSNYDCTKDLVQDLTLDNQELRAELFDVKRELAEARAHFAVVRRELRESGEVVVPSGDEESGYECPRSGCYAPIVQPFHDMFCTGCGAKFDWYPTREW